MNGIITTTFTVGVQPKHLEIVTFFAKANAVFYDVDIEKYLDGRDLWTISLSYHVSEAQHFSDKLQEYYKRHVNLIKYN